MPAPAPITRSLQIATAIVTDRGLRRRAMIAAVLIAAAQCFVGSVLLPPSITETPSFFLLFWGSCLLFVLIALGLAIIDVLRLRKQLDAGLRDIRKDLAPTSTPSPGRGHDSDGEEKP